MAQKNYPETPGSICSQKERWQGYSTSTLGIFDEIYFDDYPFDITQQSSHMEKIVSHKRINIFLDLCIQNHTKIGSKISWYLNGNPTKIEFGSDTMPFIKVTCNSIFHYHSRYL